MFYKKFCKHDLIWSTTQQQNPFFVGAEGVIYCRELIQGCNSPRFWCLSRHDTMTLPQENLPSPVTDLSSFVACPLFFK